MNFKKSFNLILTVAYLFFLLINTSLATSIEQIKNWYNSEKFMSQQINQVNEAKNIIKNNISEIRLELLNKYILPTSIVSINEIDEIRVKSDFGAKYLIPTPAEDFRLFKANYYGINHYAVLERSSKSSEDFKKLIICNCAGHGGLVYSFFGSGNMYELKNQSLNNGYDFLNIQMTGRGINTGNAEFPVRHSKNDSHFLSSFSEEMAFHHHIYSNFYDSNFSKKKPLSLMVTANYEFVNYLKEKFKYDEIIFVGLSGGGWEGVVLSALNTNINKTYSFAGSLPKAFMNSSANRGDWEQHASSIITEYDYWDLYILGLYDENGRQTRLSQHIYNSNDNCCYFDPHATAFKKIIDKSNFQGLEAYVYEGADNHEINLKYLFENLSFE